MTDRIPRNTQPTIPGLLSLGWALGFIIMVGADYYAHRAPAISELAGYALVSAVLSPICGTAIALKGGWLQERFGKQIIVGLLIIVILGIVAAWIIKASV